MNDCQLTVVICTKNPRRSYLQETLGSLRCQTVPADNWQFIIIDNDSTEPVKEWLDVSWCSQVKIVVEKNSGIAATRARAALEATTPWILFVDDDNLLVPEYIEHGIRHIDTNSQLGAFGGYSHGRFEVEPPGNLIPYLKMLAVMPSIGDRTSRDTPMEAIPWTAGMFVRKEVIEKFRENYLTVYSSLPLGDDGSNLLRGEDNEIVFTAWDLGYVTARFDDLRFTHIIPKERLHPEYFLRLAKGMALSNSIISLVRKEKNFPPTRSKILTCINYLRLLFCVWPLFKKRMKLQDWRGRQEARRLYRQQTFSA